MTTLAAPIPPRRRHDVVVIPTIRIALVLSFLVHVAALWLLLPRLRSLTEAQSAAPRSSLAVRIAPRYDVVARAGVPTPPARASPPAVEAEPEKPRPPPRVAPKPARPPASAKRPSPPIIARNEPAPRPVAPVPPAVPAPAPSPAPLPGPAPAPAKPAPMPPAPAQDLASYIAAQRQARGEAEPSPPGNAGDNGASDIARRDRIVASNLGLDRRATYGNDARNAGGLFQITELGYDAATFWFFGFDKDIKRNARQLIEVRKGANSDIRIAVVRKMISIIRDSVHGDFFWVSQRLGRQVTLSARPEDNAGLEDFILHDVFPDGRLP
jgi:outer membrane biosynthesis protein TonB